MFKESFAVAIGLKKPVIPLQEEFQDPEEYPSSYGKTYGCYGEIY